MKVTSNGDLRKKQSRSCLTNWYGVPRCSLRYIRKFNYSASRTFLCVTRPVWRHDYATFARLQINLRCSPNVAQDH